MRWQSVSTEVVPLYGTASSLTMHTAGPPQMLLGASTLLAIISIYRSWRCEAAIVAAVHRDQLALPHAWPAALPNDLVLLPLCHHWELLTWSQV